MALGKRPFVFMGHGDGVAIKAKGVGILGNAMTTA
jgi:hypothetical protein